MKHKVMMAAAAAAAAGLLFAGSGVANASLNNATLTPAPAVDAVGNAYLTAGSTVTVTASGMDANASYRVALCMTEGFGAWNVPACSSAYAYEVDANGVLTSVVSDLGSEEIVNSHAALPDQPDVLDCSVANSCEFVVALHANGRGLPVADSAAFYID